ncbi:MAG: RICIN domain-containing protein [Erysipelotrichaceae bacterium]|nr:RICIN domain-containing protein [Erysipelotrichaceae bacterium]
MKNNLKKCFVTLLAIISILNVSILPSYADDSVNMANGVYVIYTALSSKKVVDVYNYSSSDGTNIQLYDSNSTNAQTFLVSKLSDGWYKIANANGKVLDVANGSKKSGTNVRLYTYNGSDAQKWKFYSSGKSGYYYIKNKLGCVLDVSGGKTSNGTNICVYTKNASNAQKWKLVRTSFLPETITQKAYTISSALSSNKVIDVYNNASKDGTNIQLYTSNSSNAQKFNIVKVSGTYYKIVNANGKVLDVANGSKKSGTNVQLYTYNGTSSQLWQFYPTGTGYYTIRNKLGCYLDVSGGKTTDGTNIRVYTGNSSSAQNWKLSATTISSSSTSSWQYPVSSYTISQTWLHYSKYASSSRPYHLGLDITSSNKTIMAAASGTVVAVGRNGSGSSGNGNYVVIKHTLNGKTVYSFYAHLASYCVSKGTSVSKGTKIGVMGNTGNSSGTHLHFAITNTLKSGSYYGYGNVSSGNKVTYSGVTYYDPTYVIKNNKLPS